MTTASQLRVRVDDVGKIVAFIIHGDIRSRELADEMIAAYQSVRDCHTYKRVFDYRRANGLFEYDEIARVVAWWNDYAKDKQVETKVAVITSDILYAVRARYFDAQSPASHIQHFTNMREALDWFGAGELNRLESV